MQIGTFFNDITKPYKQGIIVALFSVSILSILFVANKMELISNPKLETWILVTSMQFFYILCNSLLSFKAESKFLYWRDSLFIYAILMAMHMLLGSWLTQVNIFNAASFFWIFKVLSFVYLVFIAITGLIRKIVELAMKQDENSNIDHD